MKETGTTTRATKEIQTQTQRQPLLHVRNKESAGQVPQPLPQPQPVLVHDLILLLSTYLVRHRSSPDPSKITFANSNSTFLHSQITSKASRFYTLLHASERFINLHQSSLALVLGRFMILFREFGDGGLLKLHVSFGVTYLLRYADFMQRSSALDKVRVLTWQRLIS